ncbi:MAG: stage II sporulation protein M [Chloroflexi bacterium]|nr:stage II sporulation protein M [Chloroflexota bacterium]
MQELNRFIRRNQAGWRRLDELLVRAERDVRLLSEEELDELGQRYRQTASDLALAQRDFPGQKVTRHLNDLVGRAHAFLYREKPMRGKTLRHFYARKYPQLYRRLLPYTLTAFFIFFIPALTSFFIILHNPDAIAVIMGEHVRELERTVREEELWTQIAPTVRSAASTIILTRNIQVMFLTFAGGVTAGILTLYVLFINGLTIGALFGFLQAHSMSLYLAEFVVAHGFIELSVIFFSGGVGFYVGDGLLRPGLQRRRDALATRARVGVQAILGSAPLLVVAGLIEGFISPSLLPWWSKLAVGIATGILLYGYWLLAGRTKAKPALS